MYLEGTFCNSRGQNSKGSDCLHTENKILAPGRSYKAEHCFTLGLNEDIFCPCGAQVEKLREGIKNAGRQKQKFPSALFIGVNNYLSAELP